MRECLQWNGVSSVSDVDTQQLSGKVKVSLQLADVVGIQSALDHLVQLESSPPPHSSSSSSASSSSDVASDPPQQLDRSRRTSKSSTVVVVNPARYKTELCRQFEEHGSCRYGDKCQFAHGVAEMRSLARHPKYKTEMCRTFHTTGFCPYGLRCHFIHNDDERRAAAAVLDQPGRRPDPTAYGGPVSPSSAPANPVLLVPPPPQSLCRPVFRSPSSGSPASAWFAPEADSEHRGRPILARGSTLPDGSSAAYPYVNQHVSFPTVSDRRVTGTVRALCA